MRRFLWFALMLLVLLLAFVGLSAIYGFNSFLCCGPLFPLSPIFYPLVILLGVVLYVWALASILTSKKIDGGSKIAWILVLLILPGVGLLIWLFFGPKK